MNEHFNSKVERQKYVDEKNLPLHWWSCNPFDSKLILYLVITNSIHPIHAPFTWPFFNTVTRQPRFQDFPSSQNERPWKRGWQRGCTLYHCVPYLFEFFVCHSFKHFPRDAMTSEVWSVVLDLCLGKYVRNDTIALLLNDDTERLRAEPFLW